MADDPPRAEEKPGPVGRATEAVKDWWAELKIGEGHAAAMGRLGLKELRNAFSPSPESVADSEIGLYGTQTQGEIAEARDGPGSGPEQESTMFRNLMEAAKKHEKEPKDGPEQSRGMER